MNKITLTITLIKLGAKLNKLVTEYMNAENDAVRKLVIIEANDLKAQYANKIITKDFPLEAYETMFMVKEAKEADKHYIKLYVEKANEK